MSVLTPDTPQAEIQIVEMTNAFRAEHQLARVTVNPTLVAAARAYAQFLARSQLFSHTADGRQVSDRTKAAGYAHCQVAENLALFEDSRGFETRQLAAAMVEGWKNSPGHRKNLLAPHVIETGVAIAKATGIERYVSVQLFGRPDSLKYEFRITNTSGAVVTYTHGERPQEIKPRTVVRHTACIPDTLVFQKAASTSGRAARALTGRYETRDGDVFTIRGARPDQVRIEVAPKAR